MDSREYAEWMAYHRISPFGDARRDLNAAVIAHAIVSVMGSSKGPKPKIEDFLPKWEARGQQAIVAAQQAVEAQLMKVRQ